MKLVSMAQKPAEVKEQTAELAAPETPKYPYGLCICLDQSAIDKLGWKDLPKVGDKFNIEAKVVVTSVRCTESKEYSSTSVDLQITDLGAEGGSKKSAAETLYANKE